MTPTADRVRIRLAGVERAGRTVDLAGAGVDPTTVAAAVRDPDDDRVRCPDPGPAHDHVGLVAPAALARRRALAAVAGSLGQVAPGRDRIERLRERLAELDPPSVDCRAARERVAEAGADVERRRERVASLRGRVRALREAGADASEAEADLEAAVAALAEAETERAAAEQALDRARERAREARTARERRFELADRLANREREARAWLADAVRERVDAAVAATPGATATTLADADPVTARLALARTAALPAPVVVAVRRFPTAGATADWLDAPVVRV
jgi:hypothetical protein